MATSPFTRARLSISALLANPRNARSHPEEQLAGLRASYKRFGQPRPILVRKANKMIIAGHGFTQAMRLEGAAEVDVVLWDCEQKAADAFMVADNQHAKGGVDDMDRIAEILKEQGEGELASLGFSDADLAAALDESAEQIEIEEVETSKLAASFWITVKGPLPQQAKALSRLKAVMGELSEVTVEMGVGAEG